MGLGCNGFRVLANLLLRGARRGTVPYPGKSVRTVRTPCVYVMLAVRTILVHVS